MILETIIIILITKKIPSRKLCWAIYNYGEGYPPCRELLRKIIFIIEMKIEILPWLPFPSRQDFYSEYNLLQIISKDSLRGSYSLK